MSAARSGAPPKMANPAGAGSGEAGQDDRLRQHRKAGRREAQGIAPDRNPCQKSPVWPAAKGEDAALELAALLQRWPK